MDKSADIAIVGGGVIGLAHAYMALRKKLKVVLFERDAFAVGASVRNFGMLWPIGQEPGEGLRYAMRSREHWIEVARQAGFWLNQNGSLHVAYQRDEYDVLVEFMEMYGDHYQCNLLSAGQVQSQSAAVKTDGLFGALYSATESVIYSREAIRKIPLWLEEKYGLIRRFGQTVKDIHLPIVETSEEKWSVQKVIVCNGADFETLYPKEFQKQSLTKCKLQMMKAVPARNIDIGPSLCAGLTLRHYKAFSKCPSLTVVDERYDATLPYYKEHGIHVLLSQNEAGELIIGDSHHYGNTHEPFNSEEIDRMILDYLDSFLSVGNYRIVERWNGIYPKYTEGIKYIANPEKDVTIVTGLGGAGMTLSFGLAEQVIEDVTGS